MKKKINEIERQQEKKYEYEIQQELIRERARETYNTLTDYQGERSFNEADFYNED